ncbi:MAG: ribose-phosphate pyrophosphokinase [Lachnospiraceae bacterium]|nr:ribose-phosphate pyrophosphokinase [Lachnospiraceae bacterium]
MIRLNNKKVDISHFPDGTLLLKEAVTEIFPSDAESGKASSGIADCKNAIIEIKWNYENNEELLAVYFLTKHIQAAGYHNVILNMPYIPNARQDRVKCPEDVFTLKYFAEFINSLNFTEVRVLDAHSNVSLALIDRVRQDTPQKYIEKVIDEIAQETGKKPLMFYPDEGAGKRYSGMAALPYCFGIKNRDWSTGEIKSLSVAGETELIAGSDVLIVDDICSYGGTFIHSAEALAALGAADIYLFVSHCEDNALKGKLCACSLIKQIYTTDSIFKDRENTRIKVLPLEER